MKIKTTNKQHNRMYSNNIQQRTQHYRVYSNMTRDWFQWFIDSRHCSSTSSPSLSDICRVHLNYLTIQLSSINQSIRVGVGAWVWVRIRRLLLFHLRRLSFGDWLFQRRRWSWFLQRFFQLLARWQLHFLLRRWRGFVGKWVYCWTIFY